MNYKLFKSINRRSGHYSPIDFLMILISNQIRYVFILVLVVCFFRNDSYKKATFNAGISAGLSLMIHSVIKLFFFKPRPFVKRRVGILIPSKMDSTFPSKHTLLVFAISTSLFLYQRVLGSIMWILSVFTGFSRIWVGHHYPSDIIGSAVIATMTSLIVDKIARHKEYISSKY
jgi:undecaprenyl-diphosphatase